MVTTDKVTVTEFAPYIGKTTTDYKENDMGAGVYIPNMEKPKHCTECYFVCRDQCELQDNSYDYDTFKEQKKHCPLIEIDLERDIPTVWYNRQTGQYEPKDTKQEVYERLYKLKNGERRTYEGDNL